MQETDLDRIRQPRPIPISTSVSCVLAEWVERGLCVVVLGVPGTIAVGLEQHACLRLLWGLNCTSLEGKKKKKLPRPGISGLK